MATPTVFALNKQFAAVAINPELSPEQKDAAYIRLGYEQTSPGVWENHTGATPSQIIAGGLKLVSIAAPVVGVVGSQITTAVSNVKSSIAGEKPAAPSFMPTAAPGPSSPATKALSPASSNATLLLVGGAALLVLLLMRR